MIDKISFYENRGVIERIERVFPAALKAGDWGNAGAGPNCGPGYI